MIPNLQPNTLYAVHLRAASASGGKDWVGSVTSQGEIHTFWGKSGHIIHHAGKPGDATALNKITNQKMHGKDRYYLVDEYTAHQGWQSLDSQTLQSNTSHPPSTPIVDWNSEAPASSIQWDF